MPKKENAQKRPKKYNFQNISEQCVKLKAYFLKNNVKPHILPQNLHDPAPIFQANTHQNTGQNRANLV